MVEKIKFFGALDREGGRPDGRITSTMPNYCFANHIRELEESLRSMENSLSTMPPGEYQQAARLKLSIKNCKERIDEINHSKPKLTDKDKDDLDKIRKDLEGELRELLPDRYSDAMGWVRPHEEAVKMKEGCVKVTKELARICEGMNVRIDKKGMISRDAASKIYTITGHLLNDSTNIEKLRREGNHPAYRSEVPLHEMERN